MSKIKEFLEDKNRIMIVIAVLFFVIFMVFLMTLLFGQGKSKTPSQMEEETTTQTTTKEFATLDETEMMDETTIQETTEQETTSFEEATANKEEGNIDETTVAEPETTVVVKQSPYMIKVNIAANCITVYAKDDKGEYSVPYKAMVCSTGKKLGTTPLGQFRTLVSYKWLKMVDGTYGQYAYRFYGSILFHSVPYYTKNKNDLEYLEFNKLGEPASLGCVRVCVRDAIWLIENCPIGTKVVVYEDATNPGPLGKPEMIKIPENSANRGWDPTDPDPENPWHQCSPAITAKDSFTMKVKQYSIGNIVTAIGASATDTCGNVITDRIKIGGNVDFKKAGTYTLVLNVEDAIGKTASKTVMIHVEEVTTAPTTTPQKPTTDSSQNTTSQQATTQVTTEENTTTVEMTTTPVTTEENTTTEEMTTTQVTTEANTTTAEVTTTAQVTTPILASKVTELKVTAGEYLNQDGSANLFGILSKLGLSAVDSKRNVINNVTNLVLQDCERQNISIDLITPHRQELSLQFTDAYGVQSTQISVWLEVVG